ALKWHNKLFPLCRDMLGAATNPIPIKTAMKMLGRDNGELRLPMCPMDGAAETKLRQRLVNYGLLWKSSEGVVGRIELSSLLPIGCEDQARKKREKYFPLRGISTRTSTTASSSAFGCC